MTRVLVTGASGNVGKRVAEMLVQRGVEVLAASRQPSEKATDRADGCIPVQLDFETKLYPDEPYDALFLMRPPQIGSPRPITDFVASLPHHCHVAFLSVHPSPLYSLTPHARIETALRKSGRPVTFLRPTYFMQNLTTTLWQELSENQRFYLPTGAQSFNWIDARDVAEVASKALAGELEPSTFDLSTDNERDFYKVASMIGQRCRAEVRHENPSVPRFMAYHRRKGTPVGYILVLLMLHALPRLLPRPRYPEGGSIQRLLGRPAHSLEAFLDENAERLRSIRD